MCRPVLSLLLALMSFSPAALSQVDQPVRSTLVITGASYAAGWSPRELGGHRIVNKGVGGQQTNEVLARFGQDVVAAKPAVVLIWGHINNIHRAPPGGMADVKERIRNDYREMVRQARLAGIDVILATEVTLSEPGGLINRAVGLIGRLRGRQSYIEMVNEHVRDVNGWLRTFAREQRIRLLDFEAAFDDGRGFRRSEFTSSDGTHISEAGYEALSAVAVRELAASR